MFSTPVCGRRSALPRAGMLRPANRGRVASSHVVSHAIVFAGSTKYVRQIRRRPSRRSGPFRRTRRSHRRRPSRRRPNRWFCRWLVAILPAAQALSRISGMESSGQAPGKFMHRQGLCDRGMKKRAGGLGGRHVDSPRASANAGNASLLWIAGHIGQRHRVVVILARARSRTLRTIEAPGHRHVLFEPLFSPADGIASWPPASRCSYFAQRFHARRLVFPLCRVLVPWRRIPPSIGSSCEAPAPACEAPPPVPLRKARRLFPSRHRPGLRPFCPATLECGVQPLVSLPAPP
jgi:hypothetical protein